MSIEDRIMGWNVAEAKQKFSQVIRESAKEPQLIYSHGRLVAAVVDPQCLNAIESKRGKLPAVNLADAFAELRKLEQEEDYEFCLSARVNRHNPFTDAD